MGGTIVKPCLHLYFSRLLSIFVRYNINTTITMSDDRLQHATIVKDRLFILRDQPVLLDRDVAAIYGVETKRVNEAVKNNPDKFPQDYMFELDSSEIEFLRSKISTTKISSKSRANPKAFTEKGLYMLATILKSDFAVEATFSIIETYAEVRMLQSTLLQLHNSKESAKQTSLMSRFSELISNIVLPDLRADETETSIELNFFIGKLKHTVKRKRRENGPDIVEEPEMQYGDTTE